MRQHLNKCKIHRQTDKQTDRQTHRHLAVLSLVKLCMALHSFIQSLEVLCGPIAIGVNRENWENRECKEYEGKRQLGKWKCWK